MMFDADDPPGFEPAGTEMHELIAMGDAALQAIEGLLPRLKRYGHHWDQARLLLSMLQVATLSGDGRHEDSRAIERAVMDEFGGEEDWRVRELVEWIQRDLDKPQ